MDNLYDKLRNWLDPLVDAEFRDLMRTLLKPAEQTRLPQPIQLIDRGDFLGFMQRTRRLDEVEKYLIAKYDKFRRTIIDVPFVIFAMTSDEASSLITEAVFENDEVRPAARTRFQKFRTALEEHEIEIADLLPHYKKERDHWMPHTYSSSQAIQKIISEMIERVNDKIHLRRHSILIRPKFLSAHFCAQDYNTWQTLRESNCILIVDSISLFHPLLRDILVQSHLSSSPKAVILVLSPINTKHNDVNQLIEKELNSRIRPIFTRFDHELDKWCEFGMGDLRTFQRRLLAILFEKAEILKGRLNPNDQTLQSTWNQKYDTTGISNLIFEQQDW
ncbi:MAG: hypothetical protein ACPGWR_04660 [Ardenticatenaceae bacterium]